MTYSLFQIAIPKRGTVCAKGQETLAPGSDYYSTLVETPEGFQRQDYCLTCWHHHAKKECLEHMRTYWKSKVAAKKEVSDLSRNRDDRALELLKQALAHEEHAEAFVLALYLARRRRIYLRQQHHQEDGKVLNLYEVAATEEMLAVRKLALSQLDIDVIQQKLALQMKGAK